MKRLLWRAVEHVWMRTSTVCSMLLYMRSSLAPDSDPRTHPFRALASSPHLRMATVASAGGRGKATVAAEVAGWLMAKQPVEEVRATLKERGYSKSRICHLLKGARAAGSGSSSTRPGHSITHTCCRGAGEHREQSQRHTQESKLDASRNMPMTTW